MSDQTGGATSGGPATAMADPRPLRRANLKVIEEEATAVTLREGYSLPQGDKEPPLLGPAKLSVPLKRAFAHRAKFVEIDVITKLWQAVLAERERRRAERNMNPDDPAPA